jgi:hypothetical protein
VQENDMKKGDYRNKPTDIKILYAAKEYEKIEKIFSNLEFHQLALMLALIGKNENSRIEITKSDGKKEHIFSRTNYSKYENEFDAYFALLTILENFKKPFSKVINELAFMKTEISNIPFSKLDNVKIFFEYLIGGSEKLYKIIHKNGDQYRDMVDAINDFLKTDIKDTEEIIDDIKTEYIMENEK